jgi:hypothetical protein
MENEVTVKNVWVDYNKQLVSIEVADGFITITKAALVELLEQL